MYKAKIISLEEAGSYYRDNHKVGDIVEVSDEQFSRRDKWLKVIEHYKMITVSKKKCKECGNWIIKRKKEILDF